MEIEMLSAGGSAVLLAGQVIAGTWFRRMAGPLPEAHLMLAPRLADRTEAEAYRRPEATLSVEVLRDLQR